MSVVVVTTISCDAMILRCSSCQHEVAIVSAATATPGTCTCGAAMVLDRSCSRSFALRKDGLLIRCIAENKDGWRCEDRGGRDFCPEHAHLMNPARVAQPTPQVAGEA